MSDFFLGMAVTLFVMVIINLKNKHNPSTLTTKTLLWIASIALILSIAFSFEEIVRGVKDGIHDFGVQKTNVLST